MPEKQLVLLKSLLSRKGSALGDLTRQAQEFSRLTESLRALLPADLRPHILGVTRTAGRAVILTDSAAWASRLRFLRPQIEEALAQILDEAVENVSIKVRPPAGGTRP
ncbi:MAG: DciA family protein [Gammaproteobacteria bacterium]